MLYPLIKREAPTPAADDDNCCSEEKCDGGDNNVRDWKFNSAAWPVGVMKKKGAAVGSRLP